MDVVLLSRLQFAAATMFHFLFVPVTLGLSVLIAIMETIYVRTGNELYLRMTRFWGKLFIINFALGVVTGITLEFQFGTNWSQYSIFVGDVFGSLLAIEASVAFFLESTMIGVWIFGWNKISKKAHAVVMWLIAIAGNFSAYWILVANSWMQHPIGYEIRNGRAELVDFFAVIFSQGAILKFLHTQAAAFQISAFLVMGISAYHLLKKNHEEFFIKSFRIGLIAGMIFSIFLAVNGDWSGKYVAKVQPAKLAALDAHWETQAKAPLKLFVIPDQKNEKNAFEFIRIPGMLSFLAFNDFNAEVKGLRDFPKDERPPVFLTSLAFRIMVGLGCLFILLNAIGLFLWKKLDQHPWYLKIMLYAIPLPFVATQFGWAVAEVGRQPWIVYGIMKTKDAVSAISVSQTLISLIAFIVVYSILGAVGFFLMARHSKQGPEPE